MRAEDAVRSRDWGRGAVMGMSVFVIAAALLTGLIVSDASSVHRTADGVLQSIAFAAPMGATAVLALLAWRERPWLFVSAGIALLPMTMLSFSFLLFPLVIPAFVFFSIGVARPRLRVHPRGQPWAALLSFAFVFAAVVNIFAGRHEEARHGAATVFATETGSASGSVMSTWSSVTSIAFVVAAIAIGALAPQDA